MAFGTNTPPTVSGPITLTLAEGTPQFWINPATNAFDPDFTILRAVDIPIALPEGLTWDAQFNTFLFDATNPAYDSLAVGQVQVLQVFYAITDGTTSVPHMLQITVTGTNDAATVSGVVAAEVGEDAAAVQGQMQVSDVDSGEAAFLGFDEPLTGAYGSFTLTNAGLWTYTLYPGNAAVQALSAGQSLSESFVAITVDGTEQLVTVNILGADEPVITGTAAANTLVGGAVGEVINGLGGNDNLQGNGGNDNLQGNGGNDNLQGNGGNDTLDGGTGADSLYGGAGDDVILYDALDRVQSAGAGSDTLQVARGLTANLGAADQVSGDSGTASGFEHINAAASAAAVTLTGNAGGNRLSGGAAADRLTGGQGTDTLTGGAGADRFVFATLADSRVSDPDQITDFTHLADRIDLSAIDARAGGANNAFTFINGAAFSANGQLRYDAGTGLVSGDVTGDGQADFSIQLSSGLPLAAADFIL